MLNNIAALFGTGAAASTTSYESIATVTVGAGGSSNVTFTSIPSTYKHLQIRGISRTDRSSDSNDVIAVQFNSDTGSNYAYHNLLGNGSIAKAENATSQSSMWVWETSSSTTTASVFGATIMDILDYSNTNKYKTMRSLGGMDFNSASTNAQVGLTSGLWQNTSAVSSVKIYPAIGSNFAQYSSFALYGVKG